MYKEGHIHVVRSILVVSLLVSGFLPASPARAGSGKTQVTFSAATGYASFDRAFGFDGGLILEGRAGLLYRGIGVEGSYGKVVAESRFLPERDSPVDHFGLDLIWNPLPASRLRPFLTAGWGRLDLDLERAGKRSMNGWEAGGGVRVGLVHTPDYDANLRLGLKDIVVEVKDPFAGAGETKHTFYFSAEIELQLPSGEGDADEDGVSDRRDRCPGTRWGVSVDEHGCELDTDGDGVPDGSDICPGTPSGTPVDDRGCPIRKPS